MICEYSKTNKLFYIRTKVSNIIIKDFRIGQFCPIPSKNEIQKAHPRLAKKFLNHVQIQLLEKSMNVKACAAYNSLNSLNIRNSIVVANKRNHDSFTNNFEDGTKSCANFSHLQLNG